MRFRTSVTRVFPALVLVVASLGWAAPAGALAPSLAVGTNVNVSRLLGNQAETTIAINPTNPSNIAMASNVQFGSKLFEAYSTDGGDTWTGGFVADGTDGIGVACCDPTMAFDSFGNLFLVYLDGRAKDVLGALSTDGGATFTSLGVIDKNSNGVGGPSKGGSGVDQPTVTTGPGSVWVTYKAFNRHQLLRARGAAVTGLGSVGAWGDAQPIPGSREGSFGDIVVGPSGQVMVTYQDNIPTEGPSTIFVNLDPDGLGPSGFGGPVTVTSTNVGGFDYIPPQALRSVDAESGLAWDTTTGAFSGRVYLVYTDETPQESGDTNILVRTSSDDGATWSAPVRVNDDVGTNSQFNPHIEVDQASGVVAVSFYDARSDLGTLTVGDTNGIPNDDAQYWGSVSVNGGASFETNVQISVGTSNAEASQKGVQYGDYNDMAFAAGAFHPVWADNSNSTLDNPDGALSKFDVYTARVSV
jgi:hypothetical protein